MKIIILLTHSLEGGMFFSEITYGRDKQTRIVTIATTN